MKKHIPNLITCLNLLVGVLGCISIVKGDLWNAIYFVLIAALFDFFDGFAARLLNVKSNIGKQLDSLADMISFGLLPALYMQGTIATSDLSPLTLSYLGILIAPFSAIRLAKFNVDTRQENQFLGLPTPANAIMITSLTFIPYTIPGWGLLIITLASCLLMVADIPMIALKFKNYGFKQNIFRYLILLIGVAAFLIHGISGIVIIIPAYIVLSVIGNFVYPTNV
ncbi:MAG: CDP-diacylglycerol--serine O-phosphatidyltransferase [Cyclobacteriaceae bacterium]